MSMNLHCDQLDLWQTPTHITYMCLSIDPTTCQSDGGMEGVRRRYTEWVKGTLNGRWDSKEDLQEAEERVRGHLKDLNKVKRPIFYMV